MGLSRNLLRRTCRQPHINPTIPNPHANETGYLKTEAFDDVRRIAAVVDLRQPHESYSQLEKEAER